MSRLMDVSTNWLMPIDDVVNHDVFKRHLQKNLGFYEARNVPQALARDLKEQGVYFLAQLLLVKREKLEGYARRKEITSIYDALEVSLPRMIRDDDNNFIKNDAQVYAIYIGKHADMGALIPLEKTAETYTQLERFISRKIYDGQVDVLPLSRDKAKQMFGASSVDQSTNYYDRMLSGEAKSAATESERQSAFEAFEAKVKARKAAQNKAKKLRTKRNYTTVKSDHPNGGSWVPVNDNARDLEVAPEVKIPSLTLMDRFIDANISGEEHQKIIKNFCKIRNLNVVGQAYALEASDFNGKLPAALRKSFVAAVNKHGSSPSGSLGIASLSPYRSLLGVTFSEKAGFDVFPKDTERGTRLVKDLIGKYVAAREKQNGQSLTFHNRGAANKPLF